jgi:hypothetical protein
MDGEGDAHGNGTPALPAISAKSPLSKKKCSLGDNFYKCNINQAATIKFSISQITMYILR